MAVRKTYKDYKNIFTSKKTTYNKRFATKIVADWELKVVVSRTGPYGLLLTGGSRKCRQWTGENSTLKISYPSHCVIYTG